MSGTVTIEIPAVAMGCYRVEDGLLTVTYRGRSETTQLGGSPAEVLARIMLAEMVEKDEAR
ncbi:MAG: hypothetical protein ACRYHQ_10140 [Janthinobacterium lividum]